MLKIAYQGVSGAYSHISSMNVFPNQEYLACDTFEIAMDLVQKNIADFAVIPVENSNAGRVADVHFLLPKMGIFIIGEYFLRVEHQLLVYPNTKLSEIEYAVSHPQALAQCSEFLKKHNIKAVARIDTAKSCESIVEEKAHNKAAIASKLAGELYNLEVAAANIENDSNNTTRFLIMAKNEKIPEYDRKQKYITSFIFRVRNIPAALYKALGGFATNGINMNKIESYLLDGKFVSAQFYVEIEGHPSQKAFQNAFEELKFYSEEVAVLGTYQANPFREL
ncbi:MAG: prephenate dehydratase [Alphaproteobacteria bacterium]|nr:prephenate dehydratase [Alphaproteobacteria bacterium]